MSDLVGNHENRFSRVGAFIDQGQTTPWVQNFDEIPFVARHFQPLAIFCGSTGWFVSDLVGNPENRVSRVGAFINQGQTTPWVQNFDEIPFVARHKHICGEWTVPSLSFG